MKNYGFFRCDKCIAITPCKILGNGKAICDYCQDEVKMETFVGPISRPKTPQKEQRF